MKLRISKGKIIYCICIAILGLLLIAFASNRRNVNFLSPKLKSDSEVESINKEDKVVYKDFYELYLEKNYFIKNVINSDADYIAIVTIDSLFASNWDNLNKKYVSPYSKGEASVISVLKGELPSTINYRRLGAEISYDEWIKGDVDSNKLSSVSGGEKGKKNVVVDSRMDKDIHLETGKTYLVFMKQYSCCNSPDEYTIIAYQYGAREVQQPSNTMLPTQNISSLKVKDNVTGDWVDISLVVNFDVSE